MTSSTPENLDYPDPPRLRLPEPAWSLSLVLMFALAFVVLGRLGRSLLYTFDWNPWAVAWTALAVAIAVCTPLLAVAMWTRAPRGGWPVEFRLPLIGRAFLRVLYFLGSAGTMLIVIAWLTEAGVPKTAAVIGTVVPLIVAMVVIAPSVDRWCAPVGGALARYDFLRPRGSVDRDPLTPEQVEEATGRTVSRVVRLDALNPRVPDMKPYFGDARARFVLDDDSHVEVALLLLSGQPSGDNAIERLESRKFGTTPEERLKVVRKDHRLEAVPETGEESYACIPIAGGTEWLWTRLAEGVVLEIRTSPQLDRRTRVRLAQVAAERFDPGEHVGLGG